MDEVTKAAVAEQMAALSSEQLLVKLLDLGQKYGANKNEILGDRLMIVYNELLERLRE